MSEERLPTVIIADDSLTVRALLFDVLKADFEIVADAGNGHEVVRLAEEYAPDLILMDIGMPVLDGLEATRSILEKLPDICVVMMSGDDSVDTIRNAMAAGASDYIFKPFEDEELKASLRAALRRPRERSAPNEDSPQASNDLGRRGLWLFAAAVGGAGRTTLMLSVAATLHAHGARVLVVDADLLFGDLAYLLEVDSTPPSLDDLLRNRGYAEAKEIRRHTKLHRSGIAVLANPVVREASELVMPPRLSEVIHRTVYLYDYVLVDLPAGWPPMDAALFSSCQLLALVSACQPERLKDLPLLKRLAGQTDASPDAIETVVAVGGDPSVSKMLERIGLQETAVLPYDPEAVDRAAVLGNPVPQAVGDSRYAVAVRRWMRDVLAIRLPPEPPQEEQGLFGRIFG